ncbi:MAG TPA: TonB-dependent receptor [Steroidobacteraceae bacterium]
MKHHLWRGAFAAAAGLCVCSTGAAADADSSEQVIVTAARIEQSESQVIGAVSVITRQDIEQRGAQSVQELLRGSTGIDITNNGGLGKLSNVFMRGADAEQVLVLVDGVRLGSITSGTTAFELVPVEQIERIEIVRGPRSSLYGSDAIGGVIQIFTRRAQGPSFSVGAGSNETYEGSASFGMSSPDAWLSVSASYLETEGFNSCSGAPFPPGGGCFTIEPDRDAFDSTSGSLRAGYRLSDRADFEATALYAKGTTEFDGFTNEADFIQRVLSLRTRVQPSEQWRLTLLAGQSRDKQDNFFDDPFLDDERVRTAVFETEKRTLSLQSDFTLSDTQVLTLGVDYVDDRVESTTEYNATARDNVGVFGQYQLALGAHQFQLSARHDDNEQFGGYGTGSFGWRWALSPNLSLMAAWGSAFGAPTFNDLYFPGFSNPDLDPESSRSCELGLEGRLGFVQWSVSAFENRVDDLIVFDVATSTPNNLNEARIRGIETQASASLGEWGLSLGYTALDPRNRSPGPMFDNILPRRARHSGHFEVSRAFGPVDARARLNAQSSRYDDVSNSIRVGGYATVDLVLEYALTPEWSVQGKIANALDRDYRTVRFFNQDDRGYFLNVRYRPQ